MTLHPPAQRRQRCAARASLRPDPALEDERKRKRDEQRAALEVTPPRWSWWMLRARNARARTQEQIRAKAAAKADLERAEKEREQREIEAANAYNPWGRGGAGAPLRDGTGSVITNRKVCVFVCVRVCV